MMISINKRQYVFPLIACMLISFISRAQTEDATEMDKMWGSAQVHEVATITEKEKLFAHGNFGMFIHWGLYSNLAGKWKDSTYYGIGEWIMNPRVANIPPKEYMAKAVEFNPVKFDAMKIARLAKDAGMKYIIITSKHHEGFAMFDTEVSDFDIVDATPFARDPMKELADACDQLGLGFGFYYSHYQDWTTPGAKRGPTLDDQGNEVSFDEYFYSKCEPQVREICSNYGQIDFVWFDTPSDMPKKYAVELADLVRELQPNAMLCSRIGHGMGDYTTHGDMEVPTRNIPGLWETCDTNNDSWSYAWYDNNFKSPKEILKRLIKTVARGGTYLFNVGPTGEGEIPEIASAFLRQAGQWIQKHPEVIYSANPSPWRYELPWGDITTQGKTLYLSVFEWPKNGKLYLPGLSEDINSAQLIDGDATINISFQYLNDWVVFDLPDSATDPIVSVLKVDLKKEAKDLVIKSNLGVYPNIEVELLSEFATVKNAQEKSIRWMEKFGEWRHANQVSQWDKDGQVIWNINVQTPGYYYLDLCYKGEGRLVWKTTTSEGIIVQNQQAATEKYNFYTMGILEFKTAGHHTLSVSLEDGDPKTSSLKSAKLTPVLEIK